MVELKRLTEIMGVTESEREQFQRRIEAEHIVCGEFSRENILKVLSVLSFERKMSVAEIRGETGISKKALYAYLKHLCKINLIRKTEKHQYYRHQKPNELLPIPEIDPLIKQAEEAKDETLKAFIYWLKGAGQYANHTIELYTTDVIKFYEWKTEDKFPFATYPIKWFTSTDIKIYVDVLRKERKYSENSLKTVVTALKCYFKFCTRAKLIPQNIAATIPSVRVPQKQHQDIGLDQFETLLQQAKNLREEALLTMLLATGTRAQEIVQLNLDEIDWNRNCVKISHAMRQENRVVPLSPAVLTVLRRYIQEGRGAAATSKDANALFLNGHGNRLTTRNLRKYIEDIRWRAKLRHVTVHSFRRACAQLLFKRGLSHRAIQEILGVRSSEAIVSLLDSGGG